MDSKSRFYALEVMCREARDLPVANMSSCQLVRRCTSQLPPPTTLEAGSRLRRPRGVMPERLFLWKSASARIAIGSDRRRSPIDKQFNAGHKTGIVGSEK